MSDIELSNLDLANIRFRLGKTFSATAFAHWIAFEIGHYWFSNKQRHIEWRTTLDWIISSFANWHDDDINFMNKLTHLPIR